MKRPVVGVMLSAVTLLISSLAALTAPAAATSPRVGGSDLSEPLASAGPDDAIDVIVTLRAQADLATVAAATRAERQQQAITRLQATASNAQRGLVGRLTSLQAQGQVVQFTPFWVFDGLAVTATAAAIREIAARPEVQLVALDRTIEAPTAVTADSTEPNISLVNAPALWNLGFNGQGIVVANMDTGVDAGHPDLAAGWRGGSNSWFDPNGEHAVPADRNGHGTWTMGVLAGASNGGTAIGVAPSAQWVAVKIFDDAGAATSSDIHAGFQWLLDPDGNPATSDAPHLVNNSWSMGSTGCDLEFQLDLQSLRAVGILPVFAAGNFGPGIATSASPANNPAAFAVGATDNDDLLFSGSSRGPSACGEPETIFPDLVAPGVDIRTSDLFGLYTQRTGTSLAAPHIAGALALLLDAFPDISADEQEQALRNSAVDLGAPGADNESGYGRVDVLAAYDWLTARPDFSIAAAPASTTTIPGGSVSYLVTVTPTNGFVDDIALSLTGLAPSQAGWAFTPATIAAGSGSSQLTVTPYTSLAPGAYPLTITGTSGSQVRAVTVTLVVDPPPDFGLIVSPSSRMVKRGASTSYSVTISSQGGFAGTVNLSIVGLPSNTTSTLTPNLLAAPGASTLTVTTTKRTARGTYILNVAGQGGSMMHQTTATLIVT